MNLSEKVQYLSGLMDGLGIDESTDTGKVLLAMKDILDEVCEAVDGIDSDVDDIVDFCNAMDEDLHHVEEAIFDEPYDEPPHGPHHGPHDPHGPHDGPHHGPHPGPHHPDHDHCCCHHHEMEEDDLPFEHAFPFFDDDPLPVWDDDEEVDIPDEEDEDESEASEAGGEDKPEE
ncbi:MAG: hypothetical protein LUG86_09900 [Oscillospiraceae bacterium]|nr:hypothetical protein [Oscillospiraceae bacterium]